MDSETLKNQFSTTYRAFQDAPKTMKQVSVETGIDRANICRYVANLRKRKQITVIRQGRCPVTLHRAQFLSTDPARVREVGA